MTARTLDTILTTLSRPPETPGVLVMYLFGSVAEDRPHRESDVDVGVLLDRHAYPTARDRFEARLRLIAELTSRLNGRPVDVIVLNEAPPLLARRIVTTRPPVYCTDPQAEHAFRRDVQLRAGDLEPFLRRTRRVKLRALGR